VPVQQSGHSCFWLQFLGREQSGIVGPDLEADCDVLDAVDGVAKIPFRDNRAPPSGEQDFGCPDSRHAVLLPVGCDLDKGGERLPRVLTCKLDDLADNGWTSAWIAGHAREEAAGLVACDKRLAIHGYVYSSTTTTPAAPAPPL